MRSTHIEPWRLIADWRLELSSSGDKGQQSDSQQVLHDTSGTQRLHGVIAATRPMASQRLKYTGQQHNVWVRC